MQKRISKVVIPVAGLGTRFLPYTKAIPKEMLPIVDTPSILLLVEEAYKVGFTDVVLIQGRGKSSIEDFFDISYELESTLVKQNKLNLLERVKIIRDKVNIISIRQKIAAGLGHAVLTAKPVIGAEPFAVMLGDELLDGPESELEKLTNHFYNTNCSTVSIIQVPINDVSKYGIIDHEIPTNGVFKIKNLIEKPSIGNAPSLFALPGRYVFSHNIFKYLAETVPCQSGEIQLTDAMIQIAKCHGLYGIQVTSKRFDLGDRLGFIKANLEYGLKNSEISPSLKEYIINLRDDLINKF